MKCPYNNFEECFGEQCPAYFKRTYSNYTKEYCEYTRGTAAPPNASTTIINNYYNKEQN